MPQTGEREMPYTQLQKRLTRLEQPLQSPKIVAVILIDEDEQAPHHTPGSQVIQITLGDPPERGEAAGI
jgi:hypothetical protein